MPEPLKNTLALDEASDIAGTVVREAIRHTDELLAIDSSREPHMDTLIAQHVKVQLAVLRKRWSEDDDEKVADALESMGNGLANMSTACGKHSLHVKMVSS